MRHSLRYQLRNAPTAAAGLHLVPNTLDKSTSIDSLTNKVTTVSKRVYDLCKSKMSTSRTSQAQLTESNSTLALSEDTMTTEITIPSVDLGDAFSVPGFAAESKVTGTAGPQSITNSPAQYDGPVAEGGTASSATGCQTVDSRSELGEISPEANSELKPPGMGQRFKIKYRNAIASTQGKITKDQKEVEATGTVTSSTDVHASSKRLLGAFSHKVKLLFKASGANVQEERPIDDNVNLAKDGDSDEESDDGDNDEEEVDEDRGPEAPRSDWKTIRAISNDQIETLAQKHLSSHSGLHVESRICGTYHLVALVARSNAPCSGSEWVIRIPAHGTTQRWTPEDAYMLESEVQLLKHIRQNTNAPVPQIIAWASNCENELGSPFILMTKLPGKSAYDIWFDDPYTTERAFRDADVPSTATEKKRINFLCSLARTMTEIQKLSFDKIGMPQVSEDGQTIAVGPSYTWFDEEDIDKATERRTFSTTRMYARHSLATNFSVDPNAEHNTFHYQHSGTRDILNIIFAQPVFNTSLTSQETFTIHHSDLDLQNILVDDDGNVTGIIDWDNSYAAPRCIGASAVPVFLRNDWFPRYTHDLNISPHMGWKEHYYREIYAAAMVAAGNPDAKYTWKSALYQGCIAAIYSGGDHRDLIEKLVRAIPECRIHTEDLKRGLGMGWPSAEKMLKEHFGKILEPELPRASLLHDLDRDMLLQEWWCDFDELVEFLDDEAFEEAHGGRDEWN